MVIVVVVVAPTTLSSYKFVAVWLQVVAKFFFCFLLACDDVVIVVVVDHEWCQVDDSKCMCVCVCAFRKPMTTTTTTLIWLILDNLMFIDILFQLKNLKNEISTTKSNHLLIWPVHMCVRVRVCVKTFPSMILEDIDDPTTAFFLRLIVN